ncbi:hypothetical protein [Streptomyces phaeoluteigriseus]|uniref:hypothetical protein n=1 Tax=Streptomyces phaeoluteigriseus TaxID=114686 RepID=UPI00117C3E93|nr:hypothetical protein [Streptomyces phaeoluteigriseus]
MSDKVVRLVADDVVSSQVAPLASVCQVLVAQKDRLARDPADLFAILYDELPEEPFLGYDAAQWAAEKSFRDEAEKFRVDFSRDARLDIDAIISMLQPRSDRSLLAALNGLNKILLAVHPEFDDADSRALGPMESIGSRYRRTGRLNSDDVRGLLVPKLTRPGRPPGPQKKADGFDFIRLLNDSGKIEFIRAGEDVDPAPPPNAGPVRVAFAPMLGSLADVSFVRTDRPDGTDGYRLAPIAHPIRNRMQRVLRSLDESGAILAILPEGSLSEDLLKIWASELKRTAGNARRDGSQLRWILAGTGPCASSDPPPNRAVLLHRYTGQPVFQQDKINGFTLTDGQIHSWGLAGELGNGMAYEDIQHGLSTIVCECNIGRIAISICEDLGRPAASGSDLQRFGLTHLFVPVFSQPLRKRGWERIGAEPHVFQVGTWVCVANSLVVGRAQGKAGPVNIALVVGPHSESEEWRYHHAIKKCVHPETVVCIDLRVP